MLHLYPWGQRYPRSTACQPAPNGGTRRSALSPQPGVAPMGAGGGHGANSGQQVQRLLGAELPSPSPSPSPSRSSSLPPYSQPRISIPVSSLTYRLNFFSGGDFRSQPEHTTSPPPLILMEPAEENREPGAASRGAQRPQRRPGEEGAGRERAGPEQGKEGRREGGREAGRDRAGGGVGGDDRAPPPPAARPLPAAALSGEAGNQPRARLTTPPARFKDTKPARSRRGEPGPRSAVPTPLPPPPPLRYCLVPREWTQPVATGLDP